jgi:IPT/TIG domain
MIDRSSIGLRAYDLSSRKLRPVPSRARHAAQTLTLAGAFFALLGLGARAASAHETTTTIWFVNNSAASVSLGGTDWTGGQYWVPCTAEDVAASTFYSSATLPLAPLGSGTPQTVPPYTWACVGDAVTDTVFAGTGGTIIYQWTPPGPNSNNITYFGEFVWSTPWESVHGGDVDNSCTAQIQSCAGGSFTGYNCSPLASTEDLFGLSPYEFLNGPDGPWANHCQTEVSVGNTGWQLNDLPPISNVFGPFFGYPGTSLSIQGSNFDTGGLTQVMFGSVPALSVTCPSSTQCTVEVPPGAGSVPVTLSVLGQSAALGQFTYLPTASCSYGASSTTTGEISGECTPDAEQDPIYVFQEIGGQWTYIYDYTIPYYLLGGQHVLSGVPVGTTDTFLGCTWNPAIYPSQTSWLNAIAPGMNGCDSAPTSVTISPPPAPPPPPPPIPASFAIQSAPFWSGTTSAATISLSAPATSDTPVAFNVSDPTGLGRPTGVTISATTVAAGETSAAFSISASASALPSVQLTVTANGESYAGTILVATGAFMMSNAGASLTLAFRSPTPSGSVVTFTDTDSSVASVAGSVSLAAGATTASVPIAIGSYGTAKITGTYEGTTFTTSVVHLAPIVVKPPPPSKCGDLPC